MNLANIMDEHSSGIRRKCILLWDTHGKADDNQPNEPRINIKSCDKSTYTYEEYPNSFMC